MSRSATYCPATPRCCWGPCCPLRQARDPRPLLQPPIRQQELRESSTEDLLAAWLPLVRKEARLRFPDPAHHQRAGFPPAADLDPKFVDQVELDDRFHHWNHGARHVHGCDDCVRRVYQRRRRAQARADLMVKREAIEMGLPDWQDRIAKKDYMHPKKKKGEDELPDLDDLLPSFDDSAE